MLNSTIYVGIINEADEDNFATAKVGLSGKARWFALGGIAAPCLLKVS